jgi:hypothetical protein
MHASSWHCYDINCSVSHAEYAISSVTRLANVDPAMGCTKNTVTYSSHRSVSCITNTNLFVFRSKSLHIRGIKKYDPVTTNRSCGWRKCVTHVVLYRCAFRRNSKK